MNIGKRNKIKSPKVPDPIALLRKRLMTKSPWKAQSRQTCKVTDHLIEGLFDDWLKDGK